jgi:NodT family efflux transporter outer membrane factor (OMF) lipoprotein
MRLLLLLSIGCASTPPPLPSGTVPVQWELVETSSLAATSTLAWWRSFDDPVLDRLIERASRHNLDIKIADARIREARALRGGAGAELWPELNATTAASVGESTREDRVVQDYQVGLAVGWEADLFGRLGNEARAAVADEKSAEADRAAVELLLLAEVAQAYVEYRLRRVQLSLSLETAEAQEGTVRITQARFEQGIASRFDLERALAALALTRARIPEAEELASAARHRLSLLLAESSDAVTQELALDRPLPDTDPLRIMQRPADVVAHRPDVRAAEWRLQAAVARHDSALALRYPRLTLSGIIGVGNERIGDLFHPMSLIWSLGAGLLAPIFDFGRIRAQIHVADARQEQAYFEYERTVRTAIQEAQTAIIFYAQGVAKQKQLAQALTSAESAARFARVQYQEGTLSLLEVLDAERSLNEAELSWSQATADVSLRLIAIHRALGG